MSFFLMLFLITIVTVTVFSFLNQSGCTSFKDTMSLRSNWLRIFSCLLIFTFVFLLSGCWGTPQTVIVEKIRIVKQSIPEAHLAECVPKPLLDKNSYMAMGLNEREEQLTLYSLNALATLSLCNKQIQKIRELNNDYQQKDK